MNSLFGGSLRMLYSARVYSARLNIIQLAIQGLPSPPPIESPWLVLPLWPEPAEPAPAVVPLWSASALMVGGASAQGPKRQEGESSRPNQPKWRMQPAQIRFSGEKKWKKKHVGIWPAKLDFQQHYHLTTRNDVSPANYGNIYGDPSRNMGITPVQMEI